MWATTPAGPGWLRRGLSGAALLAVVITGSAAGQIHRVQLGDTLEDLGRQYGVPVAALVEANRIADPDHVLAGSRLVIPSPAPAARAGAAPGAPRPVNVPVARERLRPLFARYAKAAGVPVDLAMALAWQESGWQNRIVSSTRAVGVMQLMPDTVEFASRILLRQSGNLDPADPAANIRMGTRFLRYLLDRAGGDVEIALASYYQGLRSVSERGPFDETRRFVANVKALRRRF
jgi:soluble lytic murein transglycosylase-like protein